MRGRADFPGMESLSDRIRRLRMRRGLSQAALAAQMGIKPPSVAEWELGDSRPSLHRLAKLASTLGVSVDELVEGTPSEMDRRRQQLSELAAELDEDALDALVGIAKQLGRAA